ncbi:MAG: hypothetical protein SAL07_16980 [Oscillatoria sp. PMC 1051.18]|nr:hypothetical protein [Oscillatoria sp. PMC 1050.18]MEC5031595.1 hypothetical protein [Oscillatoria sp. PMC 1051.18]
MIFITTTKRSPEYYLTAIALTFSLVRSLSLWEKNKFLLLG